MLCFGTELVFADAAQRADPIFGDGFPRRAGGDAVVGAAGCGVVDVAADVTDVFHGCVSRYGKLLAEVAVQQTLERLAVAGLDAIHDTVHEMARDEARHGKAFEGLLKRYFGE